MKLLINLTAITTALMLAGCASLAPEYVRPAQAMPDAAQLKINDKRATAAVDLMTWWKSLNDPTLDALLLEAKTNNQDLLLAAGRVAEARATLQSTLASQYPTLDANLGANRSQVSQNAGKLLAGANPRYNDFSPTINAAYEIDFWGKFKSADLAAKSRLLAADANQGTVLVSLYASVVQSYFNLRAADAQVTLAERTLATRDESARIQRLRFNAGMVSALEVQQAEAERAAVATTLTQNKQSRDLNEAALTVLLGRSPSAIFTPKLMRGVSLETLYTRASVPADISSEVLMRRPDLISAEQQLIAANADIGQAKAAYFPKLSLTAGVGYESRHLSDLFSPTSLLWNLVGNLTQPIFRAGAIDAVVAGSEARKQQATAQYVSAVQGAFREVHDTLVNMAANEEIDNDILARLTAQREVTRIVNLRYKSGYSSNFEALNSDRDLLQIESGVIDAQRIYLNTVVSLYKALGGGWVSSAPK